MKNQYAGFGLFSDFLSALDKSLPVDCISFIQTNPGKQGLNFCCSILMVSQAQTNCVIYHQFITAKFHEIAGSPLGDKHTDRSESAHALTLQLLERYKVRRALLAMPKGLRYVEGDNDLLRYDKERDLFFLRELAGEPTS